MPTALLKRFFNTFLMVCLLILLAGCSALPLGRSFTIPPLETPAGMISAEQILADFKPDDPLAVSDELRAFLDNAVPKNLSRNDRVVSLYNALRSPGLLAVEYDRDANYTAQQAFADGRANCMGFSNLFVASARAIGLRPRFQLVDQGPQWSQRGGYVEKALHINVVVPVLGQRYVVDISPRPVAGNPRVIRDRQALALFYNNNGSSALMADDRQRAYLNFVAALKQAPDLEMLWVNLGVLFRHNGQIDQAIAVYQWALMLNPNYHSAHHNLSVIYQSRGDIAAANYHRMQVTRYQQRIEAELKMSTD